MSVLPQRKIAAPPWKKQTKKKNTYDSPFAELAPGIPIPDVMDLRDVYKGTKDSSERSLMRWTEHFSAGFGEEHGYNIILARTPLPGLVRTTSRPYDENAFI